MDEITDEKVEEFLANYKAAFTKIRAWQEEQQGKLNSCGNCKCEEKPSGTVSQAVKGNSLTAKLQRIRNNYSVRGGDWYEFALRVLAHIEGYTVPQYGDYPTDPVEDWSAEMCITTAKKYLNRFGKQARKGEDELDLMKTAHFIQLAYKKLKLEDKNA